MDPTKLPVAVLLALGLTGCGLKDRLGPCLSIMPLDSRTDDTGADDTGADDTATDDSGDADDSADSSADAQAAADRARLLKRAQLKSALPADVMEALAEDP